MPEQSSQAGLSPEGVSPEGSADTPVQSVPEYVDTLVTRARKAANRLAVLPTTVKNQALLAMADALEARTEMLLAANSEDLEAFGTAPEKRAMADRLRLTEARLAEMAGGIREVAKLVDPLGEMPKMWTRPNGMQVGRVRVPIGVIGIIYESRPNVTADSAALCLKSGNACILRGGSEALASNGVIAKCVQAGLKAAGLPQSAVQLVATPDRAAVGELVTMREYVDIIVPRGGKDLIERLARESRIPM